MTTNKSKTRKIASGVYETASGHQIEFVPAGGNYGSAWFLTLAGEFRAHDTFPTKRAAIEAAEAYDARWGA